MAKTVWLAWSGGKDSAAALDALRKDRRFKVTALLTTVTEDVERISMHGVRLTLLKAQAAAVGLPLEIVWIPASCSNAIYERRMRAALERGRENGLSGVAFGDLFLEDLRRYREERLAEVGLKAFFPIWSRDTAGLARHFIEQGFRAILTCVDTEALDGGFAGRGYTRSLLSDLPRRVDPCGENGEFHSFVYDGPIFSAPVACHRGLMVLRDGRFMYCDLLPDETAR